MTALPTMSMLLPFTLLAPLVAMLLIVFLPKEETKMIKIVAAMGMFVSLALSIYAFFHYDQSLGGMQFTLTIRLNKRNTSLNLRSSTSACHNPLWRKPSAIMPWSVAGSFLGSLIQGLRVASISYNSLPQVVQARGS